MTVPGNHEAACAEFDGPGNILTAYLNDDEANSTAAKSALTYYSCPESQRYAILPLRDPSHHTDAPTGTSPPTKTASP